MSKPRVFDITAACKAAAAAVRDYCREDCIPRRDSAVVLKGLRDRDVSEFDSSDWFLLFDALGTRPKLDDNARDIYSTASFVWHMSHHFKGLTKG